VETEDQLTFLVKQKCDRIQGYYFSPPRPVPEIETFFEERKVAARA
jgi:EAL domain-containing protein (putative c-di-GMP-specific phosphodiesterase class I)